MKVYVAGKITGEDLEICKEKFRLYSKIVKYLYPTYEIINPIDINEGANVEGNYGIYFRNDIKQLVNCDIICMIPDWKESDGALVEYQLAEKMEMQIKFL